MKGGAGGEGLELGEGGIGRGGRLGAYSCVPLPPTKKVDPRSIVGEA